MDKELCNVIDKIAEKIGVAIDWSKENVMPYIQDIMQRYRTMSIVGNVVAIIVCSIIITICVIVVTKMIKGIVNGLKNEVSSIWFDADYDELPKLSIVTSVIIIIPLLVSVIVLCVAAVDLIGWLYVPEVEFLGVLKKFI